MKCFRLRRAFEAAAGSYSWLSCGLDKVINTDVTPWQCPLLKKPKLSPWGHLCLCYSCPCLPSSTSGSFHRGKGTGLGATPQIPPGCGICNKQPRGTAATFFPLPPRAPPRVAVPRAPQTTSHLCLGKWRINCGVLFLK